ncbi:MAG: DUF521 domain-containing protein [Crenarchaeota archaeon]|nr:DUF521 domain-containing protein [Thermoproteota archaeon]
MYLTREEERILNGEEGEAKAVALKLVVKVGEALGAERLVEINHAHASGISYDNIGEPGLRFMKRLLESGGRVAVFSTYNPAGTSFLDDAPVNRDPELLQKQLEVIRTLEAMGFRRSATCIPYTLRQPGLGEHLAWGESSAVAVANSIYGARSNREAGPLALAAALVGRTYRWGLHLPENRKPSIHVRVETGVEGELGAGLVGYIVGRLSGNLVPYIDTGEGALDERQGIALCAAAAASGSTAMCLLKGLSPEDHGPPREPIERVAIGEAELREALDELSTAEPGEAEVFFTGCPHHEPASILEKVRSLVERYGPPRRPLWIAVPGSVPPGLAAEARRLRRMNIVLLPGTCLVVTRLRGLVDTVATDSVKTAFYIARRHRTRVALVNLEDYFRLQTGLSPRQVAP